MNISKFMKTQVIFSLIYFMAGSKFALIGLSLHHQTQIGKFRTHNGRSQPEQMFGARENSGLLPSGNEINHV